MRNNFSLTSCLLAGVTVFIALLWMPSTTKSPPRPKNVASELPVSQADPAPAVAAMKQIDPLATPAPSISAKPSIGKASTVAAPVSADIYEQIRTAQRWFAYAGNTSNGSPRLVASVRGQEFDFIADGAAVVGRDELVVADGAT